MTSCYTSHGPVEVTARAVKPYPHTPTGEPSESAGMPIDMIEPDEIGAVDDFEDGIFWPVVVAMVVILSAIIYALVQHGR